MAVKPGAKRSRRVGLRAIGVVVKAAEPPLMLAHDFGLKLALTIPRNFDLDFAEISF
jgi:hypothetical protein